jgi:hypothetical protein
MKQLTLNRLILLIAFISLFAMAVRTPADTDMYWHLRTGQYILQTRAIPATDPFSSTLFGQPWIDVYWVAQVILYLTYTIGGTAALAFLVAALVMLAFVFIWKQMTGGVFLRAFVLILAATTASVVWTPRPQMATFVLTAALSTILYLYKWKRIDRLWLLPPLFSVWVNMHGGYIAGFMVLGAYLLGELINNLLAHADLVSATDRVEALGWARWRKLLIVTLVSGAALLINPFTINALLLPFKTVNLGTLQNFIEEWASPDFHQLYQQPMVWMLLLTLCAIGWSGRRLEVTHALLLIIFAYISFIARRNIGLFALICAPILASHLQGLWAKSPWADRHLSRGFPALNGVLLLAVSFAAALKIIYPVYPTVQTKIEQDHLPVAAADWILQNKPSNNMFNSYNWGGYFLWRLWPEYPVFVDGRTDVYGDEFLNEYRSITFGGPGVEAGLDKYQVNFVVIETDSPLASYLSSAAQWQVAYQDRQAIIFVRALLK